MGAGARLGLHKGLLCKRAYSTTDLVARAPPKQSDAKQSTTVHFFYLDEAGSSGEDLTSVQEPIFVLGGLSVRDNGWLKTTAEFEATIKGYFTMIGETVPHDFELHSHQLLSPNGSGYFKDHPREQRSKLAFDLLTILKERRHPTYYIAINKSSLRQNLESLKCNVSSPYLLSFERLILLIDRYVSQKLGTSARAILILDENAQYKDQIEEIVRHHRVSVPKRYRLRRIVEFNYSIDSRRHPMIQLSDLIVFCTKKYLEYDAGFRSNWPVTAIEFFETCFRLIDNRFVLSRKLEQVSSYANDINELITNSSVKRSRQRPN